MLLVLSLTGVVMLGSIAPAASDPGGGGQGPLASSAGSDWWPGYTPCTGGDQLSVWSYASGSVDHLVDGMLAGFFYNGSMVLYNEASLASQYGYWDVYAWNGFITSAGANCFGGGNGDGDDDEGEDYETAPSVSGFQSCPGSTVSLRSEASGQVGHSVYGQTQGTWDNGATFLVNTSHTSFESGSWMIWSDGGEVRVDYSYAFCY